LCPLNGLCLFGPKHTVCGHYKIGVYVLLIGSTTRRFFPRRQHTPTCKCTYSKNKPAENATNHANLTKGTSELRERTIRFKKRSHIHLLLIRMKECL